MYVHKLLTKICKMGHMCICKLEILKFHLFNSCYLSWKSMDALICNSSWIARAFIAWMALNFRWFKLTNPKVTVWVVGQELRGATVVVSLQHIKYLATSDYIKYYAIHMLYYDNEVTTHFVN